jgi:hypothetical protein
MDSKDDDDDDESRTRYETKKIDRDIAEGVKAYQRLLKNAADDWENWMPVIAGWQALKLKAIATCGTSDVRSNAYQKAMSELMRKDPYKDYDSINKATRSAMTRMMEHVEDIDRWYTKLPPKDKLNWKNPQTIVKHCPKEYLTNPQHNLPPKDKKKKKGGGSSERYCTFAMKIIKEMQETDPKRANEYKEQLDKLDLNEDLGGLENLVKSEKRKEELGE